MNSPGAKLKTSWSSDYSNVASATVTEVPAVDAYTTWAESYGLSDFNEQADPDHDSISNAMEYALGLDPLTSSVEGLPVATVNGNNLDFTFLRYREADEVTYVVESSQGLSGDWSESFVNPGKVGKHVTVSLPIVGSGGRVFARLRVDLQ